MKRPISLTLAALGGQGGGVVATWLTAVAKREKYLAQATSVPGVAQRTGATLYYLEFFAESALPADGRRPIMALMPSPGDVDIVVAAELVEAGRAMQRGLVTLDRTTLITSTHRDYTISEKSRIGDGRADSDAILEEAKRHARRLVTLDLAGIAATHGAIISSAILGAVAGAAVLPFAADSYRQAIRDGEIAVAANLAAFEASYQQVKSGSSSEPKTVPASLPWVPLPRHLHEWICGKFPADTQVLLELGASRLIDYQDVRYAKEYLDRMSRIAALEPTGGAEPRLTKSVARSLALWMSFEDTIRVAQLKLRPERMAHIRRTIGARPGQIVHVTEYLHPRVEEICGTLPRRLGRRLLNSPRGRQLVSRAARPRQVRTTSIRGYSLLRLLAALKRWRRATLRYADEHQRIADWLAQIAETAPIDYELSVALADCQSLIRGYGETHERGTRSFTAIMDAARRLIGQLDSASTVARLRRAAQADDTGESIGRELRSVERSTTGAAALQGG